MLRAAVLVLLALAACAPVKTLQLGTDGKPLGRVYRIEPGQEAAIQYRMLDSVNKLRQTGGVGPLQLNPQLTAAAATHARDMAVQNRPWHFGSDGSSPLDRARRAGYGAVMRGENISETYENEVETLAAWMTQTDTRAVIMDPLARDLGVAWYQEANGKIWWTLLTGG
jgi:uncharacterized protein YkwD